MQPFAVGTVVRFKNSNQAQNYGRSIYGMLSGLVVSGLYVPNREYLPLVRVYGLPLVINKMYVNACPDYYLEVDTFIMARRPPSHQGGRW